jgi:hypothetical protein
MNAALHAASNHWMAITVLVLSSALACTRDKPAEQPTAEPAPLPPAAVQPPTKSPPPPSPIAEADLTALVDAWVAAQNSGQFEAYRALYAAKFYGVKRAGQREQRFDRQGWMNDRQRMFRKPMTVAARELKFHASSTSADIELMQHWRSGTFEDLGPKRLLVVREAGQLKIAQEEMLRSQLVAQPPKHSGLDFYLTLQLQSGLYASLPDARVPEQLGPLVSESSDEYNSDVYTVSRSVDDQDLDASLRSLKNKQLRLEDGCVAAISGFRAMTRVIPHFSERQRWNGDDTGEALSTEQIDNEAWALSSPSLYAVLKGCNEGRYARQAESPAPAAASVLEDAAAEALGNRAWVAFTKLPSVVAAQKEFLAVNAEEDKDKRWYAEASVGVFKHPTSGQVLVSVLASAHESCAGFNADEWAVFEQKGKSLVRIAMKQSPPSSIEGALDIDGDGRLEFLARGGNDTEMMVIWPDTDERGPTLEQLYLDCPC